MDSSFVMLILSMVAFWLILDEVYGNKYISSFASMLMPGSSSTTPTVSNPGTSTTDANNNGHPDVAEAG